MFVYTVQATVVHKKYRQCDVVGDNATVYIHTYNIKYIYLVEGYRALYT